MTNAELIKALKDAEGYIRYIAPNCYASCEAIKAIRAAADVLKADRKFLAEFVKNIEHWKKQVIRLRAQLPKEGEWIVEEEIDDSSGFKWCKWRCSVCREVVKKGWQHTKDGEKPKWEYCPNCGARMMFNGKQKTESKNIKSPLEYDYCGTPKRRYDIEV